MYRRKRRDYGQYLDELERDRGIAYRPMVWSTWGRAHPETQKILGDMARTAARRRGLQDFRLILRRTRCAIGVQLARRAVAMLAACCPHTRETDVLLGLGQSDEAPVAPQLRAVVVSAGEADCR